jgi:hypothetical protein
MVLLLLLLSVSVSVSPPLFLKLLLYRQLCSDGGYATEPPGQFGVIFNIMIHVLDDFYLHVHNNSTNL